METIDTTVLNGRVKVKQPVSGGLRVTIDTIFVAAACPARVGDHIADFGAGTGAAGLCVAMRVSGVKVTFVEIQPEYADLCRENAALNGVEAEAICADIRTLSPCHPCEGRDPRQAVGTFLDVGTRLRGHDNISKFDHILCNPPYLAEGTYFTSPDPKRQKALGVQTGEAQLADWIAAAARNLKDKGSLSLIHRAEALDDILIELRRHKFGAIEIWPLQPYADKDAHRVVVRACLRRKTLLKLHPPLVLHPSEGTEKYTMAAEGILSGAKPLS